MLDEMRTTRTPGASIAVVVDGRVAYSYTGAGYWLAGYALEQASGEWCADLVSKHVLAPAGMTRSTIRPTVAMTYPLALDHRMRGDSVLMGGGTVFAPEDLRSLSTMQSRVPGSDCGYSYGLSVCTDGEKRLSHYGFSVGSGAVFTLIPDRRAAVIILANRNGGIFGRTERAVLTALGSYVNGADTLHLVPRGDSLVYRYKTMEQRTTAGGADEVYILGASGSVEQGSSS